MDYGRPDFQVPSEQATTEIVFFCGTRDSTCLWPLKPVLLRPTLKCLLGCRFPVDLRAFFLPPVGVAPTTLMQEMARVCCGGGSVCSKERT
eukprot:2495139-Amphidinium_carterae.1